MSKHVLGVKIDDVSMSEAVKMVEQWVEAGLKNKQYRIVTPNPEFLMLTQRDDLFRSLLNDSDLSIPDGAGLKLSGVIRHTTTGTDLMQELSKLASEKGFRVGLFGGSKTVAEKTKQCLIKYYPGLKVVYALSNVQVDKDGIMNVGLKDKETIDILEKTKVDILFVALGQGKQEKWIDHYQQDLPVKVTMGVGGAFDYISGVVPRAPLWMRQIGLEWLFRLINQPWRIQRQIALLWYVVLILKERVVR